MDKRYQVFVSSTFTDLKEERQAVMQALLGLDHFPAGMELFPATDDDQWTLIKGVIDDSDYYVIIIGGRYGTTTAEGISFTEMEFDYAVSQKKPILAFVHSIPEAIPAGKTDQNDGLRERLNAFKAKVLTGRHVKHWSAPSELQFVVTQAIIAEVKRNPQEGWIRAGGAGDPAAMLALREEKAALQAQVEQLSTTSPPGAENLQGGSDVYIVRFSYREDVMKPLSYHLPETTWDDIFRELGPILLHEQPESAMRDKLERELSFYGDKNGKVPAIDVVDFSILSEDFDNIKVQLFALGLIRRGVAKRPVSDRGVYWVLTPYGEAQLMRLRALRRGVPDNRAMPAEGETGQL